MPLCRLQAGGRQLQEPARRGKMGAILENQNMPVFPDLSAIAAAAQQAAQEAAQTPRFDPPPLGSFPAPSLLSWLGWAHAAGVPAVPAVSVASFDLDALLRFDEPSEASSAIHRQLDGINRNRPAGTMHRWDCCAPWGIKAAMAKPQSPGSPAPSEAFSLEVGDPRAYDILFEYPADRVDVVRRPWQPTRFEAGYPIEFRVFVHEGRAVGVSNYYVQRPLPDTDEVRAWAQEALRFSQCMVDAAQAGGAFPWMPLRHVPETVQRGFEATLDFLIAEDGRVLFLEAGPGYGLGAHPCCFWNEATGQVAVPRGLCLAAGEPAQEIP